MIKRIDSIDGLDEIADVLISTIEKGYSIVLLYGDLGSGKTTLVNVICKKSGVQEQVSSPTFSIIQEYASPSKGQIIHMDLYRIEKPGDLAQIGFGEYLDSGQLCFIEWPEVGNAYFVMPYIRVDIGVENNNIRNLRITTHDTMDA